MLYLLALDGMDDESTGDATEWLYSCSRFGRRLLYCDSQGFVWASLHKTEAEAREEFAQIEDEYLAACGDE